MEYCYHAFTGAPSFYLELLDKLQKEICRNVMVYHLTPLLNPWLIVKMYFLYELLWQMFISEMTQLVPLPYSYQRSTPFSDRLHDFSVTVPRCYEDVSVNSFFPCTARPWNSLPIECFSLTYDLNGFKSRINRTLFTVGSF